MCESALSVVVAVRGVAKVNGEQGQGRGANVNKRTVTSHFYSLLRTGNKIWPQYDKPNIYFLCLLLATSWAKLRFATIGNFLLRFSL